MNWNGFGRKRSWPNLRNCFGIFLEELKKTTKHLSQDNQSPDRDLNPRPPEHEAETLSTQRHSAAEVKREV
jgi:hypothetical protein